MTVADEPDDFYRPQFSDGSLAETNEPEDFDEPADEGVPEYEDVAEYDDDEPEFELVFQTLEAFVEYLAQILRRRLNRAVAVWCPEWWQHPEAVLRLSAMWRAFEALRIDAAFGMSMWWLQHADPHLRVLMDPEYGPFAVCDPRDGHTDRPLDALPLVPAPEELNRHPAFSLTPDVVEEAEYADG